MKKTAAVVFRTLLLLLIGLVTGLLISTDTFPWSIFKKSDKLEQTLQLIREKYVDTVDADRAESEAINNMLQNLDPHSLYLPPRQAKSINEKLEGEFNGIGIEYQLLRDTVFITQVYPGGPADRAGLKNGQRVISVNNKPFSGTKLNIGRVDSALGGARNSSVTLGLTSIDGKSALKYAHLERGRVDLSSLDAAYMAAGNTGYVKLSKFAATSDADFRTSLTALKKSGLKNLVIDLRSNGGGYLNAATSLADEFLPQGKLIVYTQGIHDRRTDYFATDSGGFMQGNLAVLIDEYSASASEILAGCLQDQDRATIVGRRSFGKGLVQEQFPFQDGSAVNLTVARYYTPSGRSIQKSYRNGLESYHNEIAERMQKGELYSAVNSLKDSSFSHSANYRTSKGKRVYSGGGIMPDIFVPVDTSMNTQLIQELNGNQLFTAYIIDKLYPVLRDYKRDDEFISRYQVSDQTLRSFIIYASGTLKEMDSREIAVSKDAIKMLLKAYLGRFKWGDTAYYKMLNNDDPAVMKAVAAVNINQAGTAKLTAQR